MIGELLQFEQYFGTATTKPLHRCLERVPKGVPGDLYILAKFDRQGDIAFEPLEPKIAQNLWYYKVSRDNTGLVFKKSVSKSRSNTELVKVTRGVQNTLALAERCPLLQELATRIRQTTTDQFAVRLRLSCPDFWKRTVYVILDVLEASIHTSQNYRRLSKELYQFEATQKTSETLDALGSPAVGVQQGLEAKIEREPIRIYVRNPSNRFNLRYGMEGQQLFALGTESRQRLKNVLSNLVANKLYVPLVLNGGSTMTFVKVLSSCPLGGLLSKDFLPVKDWRKEFKSLNRKWQGDESSLIALLTPTRGPWSLSYRLETSKPELRTALESWNTGVNNLSSTKLPKGLAFSFPTLSSFVNLLNTRLTLTHNEIRFGNRYAWSLEDSFNLFIGKETTIRKAATVVCDSLLPTFLRRLMDPFVCGGNYYFDAMLPTLGILLHKLGYDLTSNPEKYLAYRLGRFFNIANWVQECCPSGGRNNLIGGQHAALAYNNPRRALQSFLKKFKLQIPDGPGRYYKAAIENLLQGEELPPTSGSVERLLLVAGYAYRNAKGAIADDFLDEAN